MRTMANFLESLRFNHGMWKMSETERDYPDRPSAPSQQTENMEYFQA